MTVDKTFVRSNKSNIYSLKLHDRGKLLYQERMGFFKISAGGPLRIITNPSLKSLETVSGDTGALINLRVKIVGENSSNFLPFSFITAGSVVKGIHYRLEVSVIVNG